VPAGTVNALAPFPTVVAVEANKMFAGKFPGALVAVVIVPSGSDTDASISLSLIVLRW
jgi:hypothetical protein